MSFTFVGAWSCPGIAMLLVNYGKDTKALVAYCDSEPVTIRYRGRPGPIWTEGR